MEWFFYRLSLWPPLLYNIYLKAHTLQGTFTRLHLPIRSQKGEHRDQDDCGNRKGFDGTGSVAAVCATREDARTVLALVTNVLHKVTVVAQVLRWAVPFRSDTTCVDWWWEEEVIGWALISAYRWFSCWCYYLRKQEFSQVGYILIRCNRGNKCRYREHLRKPI